MTYTHALGILLVAAGLLAGCSPTSPEGAPPPTDMSCIDVPPDFDFETRRIYDIEIDARGPDDHPYSGIRVRIEDPEGDLLYTGFTDGEGRLTVRLAIQNSLKRIKVSAAAIGIIHPEQWVETTDHTLIVHIR